jgi:hypothetical protein
MPTARRAPRLHPQGRSDSKAAPPNQVWVGRAKSVATGGEAVKQLMVAAGALAGGGRAAAPPCGSA